MSARRPPTASAKLHPTRLHPTRLFCPRLFLTSLILASSALPPAAADPTPVNPPAPDPLAPLRPAPGTPAAYEHDRAIVRLKTAERELRIIRSRHFVASRSTESRQVGIAKIRAYTDPAVFPALLSVFELDARDVRIIILDHLSDLASDHADAALAWAAIHDRDEWFRAEATRRLQARTAATRSVSDRVKWSVAAGLAAPNEKTLARAAELARDLRIYDAIPRLINLQVGGGGRAGGGSGAGSAGAGSTYFVGDPGTSLAYILVGTQQAFVADLTPIVGDNAVAFDPQLAVVTEGVILRVIDAVVITYRTEVNAALIALANSGWDGRSTASLGWDQRKWNFWYANEFMPYRRSVESASTAKP